MYNMLFLGNLCRSNHVKTFESIYAEVAYGQKKSRGDRLESENRNTLFRLRIEDGATKN